MINLNIFRAYDIRGIYPNDINEEFAFLLGKGYGTKLSLLGAKECAVGHDNRVSSPSLTNSLIEGILSTGINVKKIGLCTTPMTYFAREELGTAATMMVTASHNPGNENGFKFSYDEDGNVKGAAVKDLGLFIMDNKFNVGTGILSPVDIESAYVEKLLNDIKFGNKKIKVVVDCGNGATTSIVKDVFSKIPADVNYICDESDGTFPNHHPDPCVEENMVMLKEKVLELNADVGIAFDGDGDRLGVVDNKGNFIPADINACLFVKNILLNNNNKKILFDNKCSKSLQKIILKYGGILVESRTGASYTMSSVINDKDVFGIEYSGHLYFNDRALPPISSGIYAGLRLIEILSKSNESMSTMLEEVPLYYKLPELRISVSDNYKYEIIDEIINYATINHLEYNTIDGIKIIEEDSWVLIRASNTGPNLTFMVESINQTKMDYLREKYYNLIISLIQKHKI